MTSVQRSPGLQTEEESDALRELANVAFSHAATALSTLVRRRVDLHVPDVRVLDSQSVEDSVEESSEALYVLTLRVLGDRHGTLALVFSETDGLALVDMLEGRPEGTRTRLTREAVGILHEVANVMSGSSLLAMYRMLRVNLIHGLPTLHVQTRGGAREAVLNLGESSDICIVIQAHFEIEGRVAEGIMVVALNDLRFFLDALAQHAEVH